jgi:hypothetical protein
MVEATSGVFIARVRFVGGPTNQAFGS